MGASFVATHARWEVAGRVGSTASFGPYPWLTLTIAQDVRRAAFLELVVAVSDLTPPSTVR
jgi:hypothetical protein